MRIRKSLVLAVLALAAILVWAFRPRPVPVDLETVDWGPLQVTVDEEGRTRVRHRYVVSAPGPGRVLRITLEPGDPVIAGETVVARFLAADPRLLDARTRAELEARVRAAQSTVGSARADVARVRAELDYARTELSRQRGLAAAGVVSQERVDAAERQVRTVEEALHSAEFAARTAEHQLQLARASLSQPSDPGGAASMIPLRGPIDGVVLKRLQESEAAVSAGHPLVEIGDLGELEIEADLLSTEAVRVQPDQRVLVEHWGGEQALEGRVRRVEPSGFTKISALGVEEQRVYVLIDFDDPASASLSLGDGYRVEVRIIIWEKDRVLKVPVGALFRHEDGWAVYRIEGGRAALRSVEIGQRNELESEVLSGLEAGDAVIVYPGEGVTDGVAVAPRRW